LSHLYIKVIFLPRQARDKHRESTQKKLVLSKWLACVALCYGFAMFAHTALLQYGMHPMMASVICASGYFLPAGVFCVATFRHAGLSRTSGLLVLGVWLAAMAQIVDWTYRHFFHHLLEHSLAGAVVAVGLAVLVPPLLNTLNGLVLTTQWNKIEPPLPFERTRPLFIFAFLTVARGQREMLAAVYLSPAAAGHIAYPAVLVIALGRYYTSRVTASMVDKGIETVPAAATKGIAAGESCAVLQ
jgi:hypothetical protein